MIDLLTKLPSKKSLKKSLESINYPMLFLIDIRDFKEVNLKYGDENGNKILCSLASILSDFARNNNLEAYRLQDDEFVLLKDSIFDLDITEKLITNLTNTISSQIFFCDNQQVSIETNMGISFDLNDSLKKAMVALSLAQKENRPFISYSQFAIKLLKEKEKTISKEIEIAIHSEQILPFYQKVVDAQNNTIYNEILLRLSLTNSNQPPKIFLEIAKKGGFYTTIVKLLSKKISYIDIKKGINLSFEDLNNEDLFLYLLDTYKNSNTIFELHNENSDITEDTIIKILKLKKNGIKICLDNIKSVVELEKFDKSTIDFIKIDGNIIRLLNICDHTKATCRKILQKCHNMECKSIAAHINSTLSLKEAKKLGFDYFQGFFFGKPKNLFKKENK